MKEEEYINLRNLIVIRSAMTTLSEGGFYDEPFKSHICITMDLLNNLHDILNDKINIDNLED